MSTTHNAAAIVGCRVDRAKLFVTDKVRVCKHPITDENAKFCSECGKELWSKLSGPILQYDKCNEMLCGFRVFWDGYSDHVFIAGTYAKVDSYSDIPEKMLSTWGLTTRYKIDLNLH